MNITNRTLLKEFSKDELIDYIEQLHSKIEGLASRMSFIPVTSLDVIKEGDTIMIISDSLKKEILTVELVRFSDDDKTEIIIDKKTNRFFNLGLYLQGKSWVKELKILK